MCRTSVYRKNLFNAVVGNSLSQTWEEAVNEWEIVGVTEDNSVSSECICGKEDIRYLYTIQNVHTRKILFPIGSSCIKKFDRDDLTEYTNILEQLLKLHGAFKEGQFVTFDSEWFSRKLLKWFYENGAFKPNKFNKNNPENDYEFLLKVFNARKELPQQQQKRAIALMLNAIKPFVLDYFKQKIA